MIRFFSFHMLAGPIAGNFGFVVASSLLALTAFKLTNPGLGECMAIPMCIALPGDSSRQRDLSYCLSPFTRFCSTAVVAAMDSSICFRT